VVVEFVGEENPRRRSVHPDEMPTQSRRNETEQPLTVRRRPDPVWARLKAELALWRAFLGDEIDAILRAKD
jgi:hypothetical protein